jgi:capsular polysaccharide export protein
VSLETPPPIACLTGIAAWKRRRVRALLEGKAGPALPHEATAARAVAVAQAAGGAVATWASRAPPGLAAIATAEGVPVYRIEDGFIRSAGLGAKLVPPCSLVVDRRGAHFDPSGPSDLEMLLQDGDFDAELLARAQRLAGQIVARGITKYNLAGRAPVAAAPAREGGGRRLVLVPGQVTDDRSVTHGGAGIVDMADLLARVRAAEPDAMILWKPHPDVDARLRRGALPDAEALQHADRVVRGAALAPLLARVDAVHVLTSQTGFEAMLRGREVVCHGQPFFAGWGLTRDLAPIPRRTRRLALAELVAAALILYPCYCDPVTGRPCSPEALVDRLASLPRRRAPLRGTAARVGAGWRRLRG